MKFDKPMPNDKSNPITGFIGKTIKDIKNYGEWIDIEFEDGTVGFIDLCIENGKNDEIKDINKIAEKKLQDVYMTGGVKIIK